MWCIVYTEEEKKGHLFTFSDDAAPRQRMSAEVCCFSWFNFRIFFCFRTHILPCDQIKNICAKPDTHWQTLEGCGDNPPCVLRENFFPVCRDSFFSKLIYNP